MTVSIRASVLLIAGLAICCCVPSCVGTLFVCSAFVHGRFVVSSFNFYSNRCLHRWIDDDMLDSCVSFCTGRNWTAREERMARAVACCHDYQHLILRRSRLFFSSLDFERECSLVSPPWGGGGGKTRRVFTEMNNEEQRIKTSFCRCYHRRRRRPCCCCWNLSSMTVFFFFLWGREVRV